MEVRLVFAIFFDDKREFDARVAFKAAREGGRRREISAEDVNLSPCLAIDAGVEAWNAWMTRIRVCGDGVVASSLCLNVVLRVWPVVERTQYLARFEVVKTAPFLGFGEHDLWRVFPDAIKVWLEIFIRQQPS